MIFDDFNVYETLFLGVYFCILILLSIYGSHRYALIWTYLKKKSTPPVKNPTFFQVSSPKDLPFVLVQLPIYNERYVIKRLIHQICKLNYPHSRLWIQILDDSTDESRTLTSQYVDSLREEGYPLSYVHRSHRQGYKAGALEEGLNLFLTENSVSPEYVVIFDADFLPQSDFLTQTLPYFIHEKIGMVQTRWDHLNRSTSLLTRLQSILLDGHFMVEHTARHRSGCFFNFNGTAGIWRVKCIQDAGGWEHDTLTEDLDLSYRAQLKGWQFIFLNDVLSPSELPVEMNAFKNQQHRWAKGSIQVALKILPRLLKSSLSWKVKYESLMHLTGNFAYPLMLLLSLMLPFALQIRVDHGWREMVLIDFPFFLSATVSVGLFYILSQRETQPQSWKGSVWYLPAVLGLGIGLAINNTKATIEALFGHQSPFVRTPKWAHFADSHLTQSKGSSLVQSDSNSPHPLKLALYRGTRGILPWIEFFFAGYYLYTLYYCIQENLWFAFPFMLLFFGGFLYVGFLSAFQWFFQTKFSR